MTPLLGAWLFSEPVTGRLIVGIAAIVVGLILVIG
jgi:drug/metabolite transporter (DMT)-like permease